LREVRRRDALLWLEHDAEIDVAFVARFPKEVNPEALAIF